MSLDAVDTAVAGYASKATVAGAIGGAAGWWSGVDWLGLVGLTVAVGGFAINSYFKRRQDRRDTARRADEHAEHVARMKRDELESQLRMQLMQHQMNSRMEAEE
ncbi:holin [Castellaniella denitrificans]|uniref:Holin n=1 Tax=Castellaniella denitrificans TaxID=56119 RepID=A0ABT4M644_9BURK|nr:holin [Castellaniella denitrificans]MCZ4330784.1 holin [Castellaniella denitrificans]